MQPQLAEVTGKVISINQKNKSIFHIYAENANKKFKCIYEGFLLIKVGDALQSVAEYSIIRNEETLTFKTPPYVIIGSDKVTLMEAFASALRGTGYTAKKGEAIYNILLKEAGEESKIVDLLNSFAMHYNYEQINYDPFTLFSTTIDLKQFIKLCKYVYKNFILRKLYLLGLNNKEINSSKYNPLDLYDKVHENPYSVTSLSLEKCDDILSRCGKPVDFKFRECGKIVRKISDMMDNGWTGVPSKMLLRMFPKLVDFMPMLKDEFGVATEMHTVYLNYPYEVETFMCEKVKTMLSQPPIFEFSDIIFTRDDLSPEQKEAIEKSLRSNISIITGGGGSGKSTCIKELVYNLEKNGIAYRLASFTGKAVSRIREVTGKKEPATLHMMISLAKGKPKTRETFKYLILDESSMITSELLYEFMKVFPFNFSIIFLGDKNQLPVISWGNLFESLIESKIVPTTYLKTIHRTNSVSDNGILINANRIIRFKNEPEENEEFDFEVTPNFKVIPGDIEKVKAMLVALKNSGIDSDKLVIISPYNRDLDVLNSVSSTLYNGNNRSIIDQRKKIWRIGDRVMLILNDYKHNLMNGTEGKIIDCDVVQEQITVQIGAESFIFKTSAVLEEDDGCKELNTTSLILSYSISCHRSQGSEYDYVIGYTPEGKPSSTFLNSNLLYTLITRTKKMIWLIGDIETLIRSATTKPSWRCSNLTKRLLNDVLL